VERIRNSKRFNELASMEGDPGILFFERAPTVMDGRRLLDAGDIEAGKAILQQVVENEYDNPEAWANLTLAYVLAGQQEDALEAGEQALTLKPDHFYVHVMMAEIQINKLELEKALVHVNTALFSAPNPEREARTLLLKANIMHKLGRPNSACIILDKSLEVDPEIILPGETSTWSCDQ
jgi:tetratricopeptide (TPR) repeat protein